MSGPDIEVQFRNQFKEGRTAPLPLWDYWAALDGKTGELGYEWSDKPHRLVFDLLHHAVAQAAELSALRERCETLDREAEDWSEIAERQNHLADERLRERDSWRRVAERLEAEKVAAIAARDEAVAALERMHDLLDAIIARDDRNGSLPEWYRHEIDANYTARSLTQPGLKEKGK